MFVDKGVILAAGLGTRLKWMTQQRPKALMPIQGEAAIVHVIRQLAKQGVHQVVVNVHHHADILMDFLGNGDKWGVNIQFSQESELLDSGGGVRTALQKLSGDGAVVVYNADVLADIDVQKLADSCPKEGCSLALVENPAHHKQGDFSLHNGRVALLGEPRFTFSGVSVWHARALKDYPLSQCYPLLEPIKNRMNQGLCSGVLHRGQWFDIGRPKDVLRASKCWKGQRL